MELAQPKNTRFIVQTWNEGGKNKIGPRIFKYRRSKLGQDYDSVVTRSEDHHAGSRYNMHGRSSVFIAYRGGGLATDCFVEDQASRKLGCMIEQQSVNGIINSLTAGNFLVLVKDG